MSTKLVTRMVPLDAIAESGTNPRRHWDEKAMAELTESVRIHGVVQPILVRPIAGRGQYGVANDVSQDKVKRSVVCGVGDAARVVAGALTPKQAAEMAKRLNAAEYLLVAGERRWRAGRPGGL